ncbi:hypothetical protein SEVIR_9G293650v4 [Setaria viridis]
MISAGEMSTYVMKTVDGGLGLIALKGFFLWLWVMETNTEGATSWVLHKVIDLEPYLSGAVSTLPSTNNHTTIRHPIMILGIIEDEDVVFLWMISGVFVVKLKSMQFKKMFESDVSVNYFFRTQAFISQVFQDVTMGTLEQHLHLQVRR